jgi:hypothetical protein
VDYPKKEFDRLITLYDSIGILFESEVNPVDDLGKRSGLAFARMSLKGR